MLINTCLTYCVLLWGTWCNHRCQCHVLSMPFLHTVNQTWKWTCPPFDKWISLKKENPSCRWSQQCPGGRGMQLVDHHLGILMGDVDHLNRLETGQGSFGIQKRQWGATKMIRSDRCGSSQKLRGVPRWPKFAGPVMWWPPNHHIRPLLTGNWWDFNIPNWSFIRLTFHAIIMQITNTIHNCSWSTMLKRS